ncbi:MAG: asparagine synthase-related protein, partial [Phycisphaerales bacterium JB064]
HVRVALSGDGGDDIFLGYDRHRIIQWLPKLQRMPKEQWEFLADFLPGGGNPKSKLSRLRRIAMMMEGDGYKELVAIFPRMMLNQLGVGDDGGFCHWGFTADFNELWARRFDAIFYLPEDILRKSDSASMAASLEVRAPFLARSVAQPALNTQLDVLMPNNERKGLLKQVARKYLPDHIVDRPKQGFAIPIGKWFRDDCGGLRQLLYDHLESADPFPGLGDADVEISMGFVRQMLREHDAAGEKSINPWHGRDHSQRLYMLLVLSIWAKWLDGLRRGGNENPSHGRGAG